MLGVIAAIALAFAVVAGYALSERGLPFIVARIVAQSGGRISVEGATGSIAGTMRFRRIAWRGTDASVVADDVAVDWSPGALWRSRVSIQGLGARHLEISIKPSTAATPPPVDLALPLAVSIEHIDVGEIDWRAGPRSGHFSGIEFGYDGDDSGHRIHDLRFVSDLGTVAGSVSVAARAPLAVSGSLSVTGAQALAGASLEVTLGGTLPSIALAAKGRLRDAPVALNATLTPFARSPFATAHAELTGFDAARFDAVLPSTRAGLRFDAHPAGAGIAGTLALSNQAPGPLDAARLPVTAMTASYAFDGATLTLDDLAVALAGGGQAQGSAQVAMTTGARAVQASLALRDVDLARVDTRLVATRLSGKIEVNADATKQTITGDLAQRDIALEFAATITDTRIDVTRFRARTGGGSLAGSASLIRNDAGDFSAQAVMRRLDPSRFVAMPSAALDGSVKVTGVLNPLWRLAAGFAFAPQSRIHGLALAGTGKVEVSASEVRAASISLAIASARLHAAGNFGHPGDHLTIAIDAPRIADLDSVLPAAVPRPVAGDAHVEATLDTGPVVLRGTWFRRLFAGDLGGSVAIHANGLRAGKSNSVGTLALRATLAAPAGTAASMPRAAPGASATLAVHSAPGWQTRGLSIDVDATAITTGLRSLASAHANATGTLADHRVSIALRGRDIDATAGIHASLANLGDASPVAWRGTLSALENRGAVAFKLTAPATFTLSRERVELAGIHLATADGRADVDEFAWTAGRITSRGNFTGVALARAAALAGHALPFASTLVLGGDWSIDATPRLHGRFALHRERGDLYASDPESDSTRQGLGISAVDVAGTLDGDVLDARASFASALAGNAVATLHLGLAPSAPPGTIGAGAPLVFDLRGDFASLALLQPWVGTRAAVGGSATLNVAARGTLGTPRWTGSVDGKNLRIDAPQYGIDLTDGRLRAHLAPEGIALDEVSFAGGDGRITASGTLALPTSAGEARTRVTWRAQRFRATNRPDLRFVVDGNGSIILENRKLALAGSVKILEGHVEYQATPSGRLAPDIVVTGAPLREARDAALRTPPVALDMDVDLGPATTFSGEGLETRLAGKVRITTAADGSLAGHGTIRAVNGTYYAFGQQLTIDRGRLIFDGALDNPALDVVALRKNLPVEAGVALTGSVRLPQVRVTSSPPVPENEALAWLLTGQGLNATGRADYAALSAASALLLSRNGRPLSAQIAQRFGLDEISLQSVGAAGTAGATNQVRRARQAPLGPADVGLRAGAVARDQRSTTRLCAIAPRDAARRSGRRKRRVDCLPADAAVVRIRQDFVERPVALLQSGRARQEIAELAGQRRWDTGGRRSDGDSLRFEFGTRAGNVEAVDDEDHVVDSAGFQDRGRIDGVFVGVARSGLDPAHRHAEFARQHLAHQQCLDRIASLDRPTGYQHR